MASLKQLVLATCTYFTSNYWDDMKPARQREFQDMMDHLYSSGMKRGTEQQAEPCPARHLQSFLGHTFLKAIIHADPETKGNGSVHVYQNGNPYRFSLNFGLKVGYAELSHFDVVGMVHPDPEMRARGMFREIEFE
jgi:hypothetical protein